MFQRQSLNYIQQRLMSQVYLIEFICWWNFIKQEIKNKLNIEGFEGHLLKLHYNRKTYFDKV